MNYFCDFPFKRIKYYHLVVIFLFSFYKIQAQPVSNSRSASENYCLGKNNDLFSVNKTFIENIGQYGDTIQGYGHMGKILYGFEGIGEPVLFTGKGLIHLQKTVRQPDEEARERMERKGMTMEQIAAKTKIMKRVITAEWLNSNPDVQIIPENIAQGYHTYGKLTGKAAAFYKITYKELYKGVDLIYSFDPAKDNGFEYSLVVRPNADLSGVKLKYGGNISALRKDFSGNLVIKSDIGTIKATIPVSYYGADVIAGNRMAAANIKSDYIIRNNEITFHFPDGLDRSKNIVIDPFISATGSLSGGNASKAKDVDYDYAGNVYVSGGGDGNVHKLAKFDATGALLWTFTGTITLPAWSFGPYYGGWVVEKSTGNMYMGHGFNFGTGYIVVRLNTAGIYDNYISTGNGSANEDWKMFWTCNNGSPQILIAGGGTSGNLNLGVLTPPSPIITGINLTGLVGGCCQDVVDIAIDPANLAIYPIYASLGGMPFVNNRIYKNTFPYNAAFTWSTLSGYTPLSEANNRPYMVQAGGAFNDNSANILAINSTYLFYWDGKNLQAFDKATGNPVGTPITFAANTALMQGGIEADECNNIFIGSTNGTIKVYNFNGSTFNDAPADITVSGFTNKSIYDLVYNDAQKILYVCGDGFVGSFDVSAYGCVTNPFVLTVNSSCGTSTATTTISPIPPAGSTVTYILFNGTIQIATNTTGVFTGLSPNITYTIKAIVNQACSGSETNTTFTLPGPAIAPTVTNTSCGTNSGSVLISATGGVAPYTYSKDGVTFQASNSFTALAAGFYTITVKDVNGCSNTIQINIINSNGPTVTFSKTDAICGSSTGIITGSGSGGTAPLSYSINGTTYQSSPVFSGVAPGTYTLTVKDFTGCTNVTSVTINNIPGATASAIPATTYCNTNNGSITVIASGGSAPLQYSLNGNTYQASNIFNNLFGGIYTVTVKDANGCLTTANATVANVAAPTVTATAVTASCSNANGSITANGVGGTAPLQYSINGSTFQASNFFGGLTAGTYVVTVKDANNCTNTVSIVVSATGGPSLSGTSTLSACNTNTGTITLSGSGGTGLLQYSLNGVTFQTGNTFTGLSANVYFVYVRDAIGCLGATVVVVSNTASPTLNTVLTPTACNLSNGVITANATGGTAPYQYSINNGVTYQASNTFTGVATGPYAVIVKDVNGCTSAAAVVMTNVAGLSITASNISTACSSNSGSITANGVGGVAPLQYSINGVTYQSGNTFNNLAGGNYVVYVKDANGCISTVNVTILSAQGPQITATATNATCASSNAIITATASGGVSPLQYSINGSTYQSSNLFLNVAPGTYTVYVKDAVNCIQTTSVTITNTGSGPGISTFTVVTKGTYSCNGDLGKITNPRVNGSNCNSCTFSLNFGPFIPNAAQLFTNLVPGTYTVTAMDANGCTKSLQTTIGNQALSTATATVVGTPCGTSNGSITITGIGPNTPYHASINGIPGPWNNFNTTFTFSGLAPGVYTITMADDADFTSSANPGNCLTTISVIVPSTGGPTVTATQTAGTCGLSNGSINASATAGIGPFTYSIDGVNYQNTGVFTGLAAGTYTITVMDGTGCTSSLNISVTNTGGATVTAVSNPISCGSPNGSITASASGGTGPYQYSINGFNFQSSTVFNGLAAGNYTVWVQDAGLCLSTTTITVGSTARPTVTALAVATSCNNNNGIILATGASGKTPYQYSLDGITFQSSNLFIGLAAGFYTVTIKDANGCLNTTGLSVGNLLAPTLTLASTPATCLSSNGTITSTATGGVAPLQYSLDGVTYQGSNIFSGLTAGSYTVYVKDFNGCVSTKSTSIASPNVPQTLTATVVNASCGTSNGSMVAAATGGVAPLQYSINGTTFQASTSFSALASGSYTLTVRDANLCTKTLNVNVLNLAGPTLAATSTLASCIANDGTITANATGGTGALTYSKNGVTFQSSPVFNLLAPGPYTITVRDTKGCTSTTNIIVGKVIGPTISATTANSFCGDTIIVGQTGGTPTFQYNLNTGAYQGSNLFPCQSPGPYMVHIIDANGCRDSISLNIGNPLPVELISFKGHGEKNYNVIEWITASEVNSDYFLLEKSRSGYLFETLATIDGAGNSSSIKNYSQIDNYPFQGVNYYRLNQVDFDGTSHYSGIIAINSKSNNNIDYVYSSLLNQLLVSCGDGKCEIDEVELYDVAGRKIFSSSFDDDGLKINTADFAKGYYSLQVITRNDKLSFKVSIY